VTKPHDHLFQQVFADPEHAVPLLRSALPAPLAEAIDWSTLQRRPTPQRGRRGKTTICDVLFAVDLADGRPVRLYVVLEHKSQSRRFDALQMLEQVAAILRGHRREHPDDPFLPPVLPVVVHADGKPWRSPLQVRDLFDLDHLPPSVVRYLPALEFVLDDLHGCPPDRLRRRALTVFGLCALSMLQYLPPAARDAGSFAAFVDAWADVQEHAARLGDTPSGHDLYETVVDYVLATSDLPRPVLHHVLSRRLTTTAMKKFVSTLVQTRNEGIAAGKAAGKAEGKAEGRAELLLRQLARRFGAAAASSRAGRLQEASLSDLERWADRVLDAATIEDVFTAPDRPTDHS
jgi:predicted transposase YdaD